MQSLWISSWHLTWFGHSQEAWGAGWKVGHLSVSVPSQLVELLSGGQYGAEDRGQLCILNLWKKDPCKKILRLWSRRVGYKQYPSQNAQKGCFPYLMQLYFCIVVYFGNPNYGDLSLTGFRPAPGIWKHLHHWQKQCWRCRRIDIDHKAAGLAVFPSTLPKTVQHTLQDLK